MADEIVISEHAVDRYMSLTYKRDRERARETIKNMFEKAERVKLSPEITAQRIINSRKQYNDNQLREASYYEYDAYRMVVVDGTMVTLEKKFKDRKKKLR